MAQRNIFKSSSKKSTLVAEARVEIVGEAKKEGGEDVTRGVELGPTVEEDEEEGHLERGHQYIRSKTTNHAMSGLTGTNQYSQRPTLTKRKNNLKCKQ